MSTVHGNEWDFLGLCHFVPDGLVVQRSVSHGYYGIYATKAFSKGSILYYGRKSTIPNVYKEYDLKLEHADGVTLIVPCNTHTHSVQFSETERWLYFFDGFMNHSCDPTTISHNLSHEEYHTIALRDILPGDEITCDYNTFEYDCRDKSIEKCLCGSNKCLGRVAGFRYLTVDQQKERVNLVDTEVLMSMSSDEENKFLYCPDVKCPTDRVLLKEATVYDSVDTKYRQLVAARNFCKGDIVYSNEALLIPDDWSIVMQTDHGRIWLDLFVHTINKGNRLREFYLFDSFQNHSCDPNTFMRYKTENTYDVIASKDIRKGDEVTIDYEEIPGFDGKPFNCNCNTINCRQIIKA